MRKRNLNLIAENIIIVVILLAPLLLVGALAYHNSVSDIHSYLMSFDGIMAGVPFYDILDSICGVNGTVPLIPAGMPYILDYIAYVATFYVFYLVVKVLVFVPKLVNVLLDKMGGIGDLD